MGVETAQQDALCLPLVGEQRAYLRGELVDQLRGVLRLGIERRRLERQLIRVLRIGVAEPGIEPVASEHHEHPVLAFVPEEHVGAVEVHPGLEPVDDRPGLVVGNSSGAAVGDATLGVERAQVASGGDVARAQLEVETRRARARHGRARNARGDSRRARGGRAPNRA